MEEEIRVWVVRFGNRPNFALQWRDPITRKLKTKTTKIPASQLARDRKAAERLAGELQAQLAAGSAAIPSKFTWAEFRQRYEAEVVPGLARRTGEKIQTVFDRLEVEISPPRVRDLTESRLSHFAAQLRKSGLSESTLAGYLAHLKSALGWAVAQKILPVRPVFPKIQRAKKHNHRPMKGRPITTEEFDRMLEVVPKVVGAEATSEWRHYLRGLWVSGLRLSESLELWWDRLDGLYPVFPKEGRPMLHVPGELEKGHADRLLPIAPEFAMFLAETPENERTGPVFSLRSRRRGRRELIKAHRVSEIISKIGERAGVRVYADPKRPDRVKFASAHDLRRAFGERWAGRLMPAQLMELMRHESIETTLRFYVGRNAQRTAEAAWLAYEAAQGGLQAAAPNKAPNTASTEPTPPASLTKKMREKPGREAPSKVDRAGIEPATHGFSVRCSTN